MLCIILSVRLKLCLKAYRYIIWKILAYSCFSITLALAVLNQFIYSVFLQVKYCPHTLIPICRRKSQKISTVRIAVVILLYLKCSFVGCIACRIPTPAVLFIFYFILNCFAFKMFLIQYIFAIFRKCNSRYQWYQHYCGQNFSYKPFHIIHPFLIINQAAI